MSFTDVQIINLALSEIPAANITARSDTSESARSAALWYDYVLTTCLRRGLTPWPFATKRMSLVPTNTAPVNEFANQYELPGECLAVQKIWPDQMPYRIEEGFLYTDAETLILKYTSNTPLDHANVMYGDFIEYFRLALAAAMAPKLAKDTKRQKELKEAAEVAFRHASAAFSMEDTPDAVPNGPWIDAHEGNYNYVRESNWIDLNSLPS